MIYLSPSEYSKQFHISYWRLLRLIKSGEIKARKGKNGRFLIELEEKLASERSLLSALSDIKETLIEISDNVASISAKTSKRKRES